MMTGAERTAMAITAAVVLLLIASKVYFKTNKPMMVQESAPVPYYQADSLEALNWTRQTYIDSVFHNKIDSVVIPYRAIFEFYADSLDLDWRLLAAIAYQESRFDLKAKSHMGAVGLMQITGATAERYEVVDPADPLQNVMAGTFWLKDLLWRYRGRSPEVSDRLQLALAAYNAGPAHITRCIDTLRVQGTEVHNWEDISSRLTEMDFFNSTETDNFVRRVHYIYGRFRSMR